jgi:hypothetical protein
MKLPRYTLRKLFVLVALVSVTMGWVAYQLNWIRQRHVFINRYSIWPESPFLGGTPPWPLGLFGETGIYGLCGFPLEATDEAKQLFPEATTVTPERPHREW